MVKFVAFTSATSLHYLLHLKYDKVSSFGTLFILTSLWLLLEQVVICSNKSNRVITILAQTSVCLVLIELVMIVVWPIIQTALTFILLKTFFDSNCAKCMEMMPLVIDCLPMILFVRLSYQRPVTLLSSLLLDVKIKRIQIRKGSKREPSVSPARECSVPPSPRRSATPAGRSATPAQRRSKSSSRSPSREQSTSSLKRHSTSRSKSRSRVPQSRPRL